MPTTQDRIEAAEEAIQAHRDATREYESNTEEVVIDLLTNLRHLAEAHDLDFTALVRISKTHHMAEQNG